MEKEGAVVLFVEQNEKDVAGIITGKGMITFKGFPAVSGKHGSIKLIGGLINLGNGNIINLSIKE